jgi:hypothetical protein
MLSSRLLNDMFVSRVNQIREYNRGVNGSILSSRLLNDVHVSDHATINITFIVYGLIQKGHEHII